MKYQTTNIINWEHFLELCYQWDNKHGLKTYSCMMTLEEMAVHFEKQYRPEKDIDYSIRDYIKVFDIKKSFYSDDLDIPQSPLGKMNSTYLMCKDIVSGKKFTDPASVSLFPNGETPLHPGQSKLNFSQVYKDKISVFVTDYNGDAKERFDFLEPLEDNPYDFNNTHQFFTTRTTNDIVVYYKRLSHGNDWPVKQIWNPTINHRENYHQPRQGERRYFEFHETYVTVNGLKIFELGDNNLWKIILDDRRFKME